MPSHQIGAPIGPYSSVVRAGDWLVCSGQLGLLDGELVPGGITAELSRAFSNLSDVLETEGAALEDVVKITVFLRDIADYEEMNRAYLAALGAHRPARTAVAVGGLPRDAAVELDAWAHVRGGP